MVAGVHRVVLRTGDELHSGPLAAEEAHRVIDERLERVRDLAGVAKVVVEDQWYERHRRRAVPAENTLTFVGEDVQATGFVVLQSRQQRVPPRVGEILGLVDDDRVEPLAVLELGCQISHLKRQVVLPELHGLLGAQGFVGPFGCSPAHAEGVELADVGQLVAAAPIGGDALQVGGQAVGVAEQGHPLARRGKPTGLFHREKGLAAARPPADLNAVQQSDGVEDDGLMFGQRVGGVLIGQRASDHASLR